MDASLAGFNKTINTEYNQGLVLAESLKHPSEFWLKQAAETISWKNVPKVAYTYPDANKKQYVKWFPDGKLNVCYNAIDRHLASSADKPAIIYDSPVTATKQIFTYKDLYNAVSNFSKVLYSHGIRKGDTVLIYMPMIPQTVIAILACSRIGAIHSVVFGGFSSNEIAKRIQDCKPKVLVAATCGIEGPNKIIKYKTLVDNAVKISSFKPTVKIFYQRPQCYEKLSFGTGDRDWSIEMANVKNLKEVNLEYVDSNHPLYILYTSGTTSAPKGVIRPSGPHVVNLIWTMKYFFGLKPSDTIFCTSDLGWVVGHTYVCYAPLLFGATTILYEGKPVGTPDAGSFFRIIEDYKPSIFLSAPTAMMVLRKEDSNHEFRRKYDLSSIRGYFYAGERCVPEIAKWWVNHTLDTNMDLPNEYKFTGNQAHSVDHWWQTESGSPITGICLGLSKSHEEVPPIRFGSAGLPLVGVDLRVIKSAADPDSEEESRPTFFEEAKPGTVGNIAIKLPLPPGFSVGVWGDNSRFDKSYFNRFPGFYDTGDVGYVDEDGYVYIMSRDDDIINVAAHRLSTSAIEEVVVKDKHIAEACVIPKPDPIKGSVPMAFCVLNTVPKDENHLNSIKNNISSLIRSQVGAIASIKQSDIVFIPRLPKTRSGKILRRMIRSMVAEAEKAKDIRTAKTSVQTPPTIDDPAIKDEIWVAIVEHYASQRSAAPIKSKL
ncbi:hypothetical protein BB560_006041 [Smittium megazygosporum]|uniref:AMP-dependent synthetase/ligase domain-containing protein n=1 Tax=Smittium megazygosporum TaxID=133381 RepID=A0A2T9YJZ2_9FUNG|nr:hypothetical protein BB560_006041 [Smittium megazygosporum]